MSETTGQVLRQLIRDLPDLAYWSELINEKRYPGQGLKIPQINLHALDNIKGSSDRVALKLAPQNAIFAVSQFQHRLHFGHFSALAPLFQLLHEGQWDPRRCVREIIIDITVLSWLFQYCGAWLDHLHAQVPQDLTRAEGALRCHQLHQQRTQEGEVSVGAWGFVSHWVAHSKDEEGFYSDWASI